MKLIHTQLLPIDVAPLLLINIPQRIVFDNHSNEVVWIDNA